jgi:KDO2-lipid IV(A) lauroyltransferase
MKLTFVQRHAYGWGAALASLLWPFFPGRRRLAVDNILKGGVTDDPAEARRIAKASWRHLAGHIAEALCVPAVIGEDNWREHLDVEGASPDAVKLLLEERDRPIIIASAHHGAWEAATNLISFARPMIAIARAMNSKFVSRWMEKHHFRGRITVIDKNHGFTPDIMRQWLDTKAAMTILIDQHSKKGAKLTFFGRTAMSFTSATRLAIRYGAPIVVGTFVRIGPYRYRLVGGDPVTFPRDADRDSSTQLLNDRLEEAIRKYPEQYLWFHKRWRNG